MVDRKYVFKSLSAEKDRSASATDAGIVAKIRSSASIPSINVAFDASKHSEIVFGISSISVFAHFWHQDSNWTSWEDNSQGRIAS